ncbi:hypothetical protein B0H13DRAFT_1902996 [Mycena leptocephala]|nr:hypothetical protein B0H13DRAFT_1902996 [Mycena leptocephala]
MGNRPQVLIVCARCIGVFAVCVAVICAMKWLPCCSEVLHSKRSRRRHEGREGWSRRVGRGMEPTWAARSAQHAGRVRVRSGVVRLQDTMSQSGTARRATEAEVDYADVFLLAETKAESNGEKREAGWESWMQNSAHTGVLGRVKPEKRSSKGGEASLLLSVDGERCKVGAVEKTGLEGGLSLIGEGLLSQGLVVVGWAWEERHEGGAARPERTGRRERAVIGREQVIGRSGAWRSVVTGW